MPASSNQPAGNHYPGMDCMTCHDGQTAGAPPYTIAGTLFATGATPIAGATILITDSNNQTQTLISASNGNFYSTTAVAFPLTSLGVSDCSAFGSGVYMNSEMPVRASAETGEGSGMGGASCNSCHIAGQDAPPMHLP